MENDDRSFEPNVAPPDSVPLAPGTKLISSADLFAGCRELVIRHGNDLYRLRITKAGKLILNK
jgi:hemin uptake protein HemP